jgi:hypothetical protein
VDAASLHRAWTAVLAAVQALSFLPPPPLEGDVWDNLATTGQARLRSGAEVQQVVGLGIFPAPQAQVWLALTDDRPSEAIAGLTEIALRGAWTSPKLLYGHLDLPWPFQDRQWVIELRNNTALAQSSGVWERHWSPKPEALELARPTMGAALDSALLTPENEGNWILLALSPTQTLGIYQTRVSMGGVVPDSAVDAWAASSLKEVFDKYTRNALNMPAHYGPGCSVQKGANDVPIPCFGG